MSPLFPAPRSADLGSAGAICASAGACAYAGVQPSAPAVPSISPILMRFFILYLSLPLYFSQAGWLLWQPVALARFQTALMQEVITPDFQLTRSEEHTSELQSLMRISYAVFCLKKKTKNITCKPHTEHHIHNNT